MGEGRLRRLAREPRPLTKNLPCPIARDSREVVPTAIPRRRPPCLSTRVLEKGENPTHPAETPPGIARPLVDADRGLLQDLARVDPEDAFVGPLAVQGDVVAVVGRDPVHGRPHQLHDGAIVVAWLSHQ